MKYFLLTFIFFVNSYSFGQNKYNEIIQNLKENNEYNENVICYTSTLLAKAEFYVFNNNGYVIVYIKQSDYDIYGKPYLFCNISEQRWRNFINGGIISWGQSYSKYIKSNICDFKNNTEYEIPTPKSSYNIPLIERTLNDLNERPSQRTYSNNYSNTMQFTEIKIGKSNLNYKFSAGIGLGINSKDKNSNELTFSYRIGNKGTIESVFSKYTNNTSSDIQNDLFEKQFGITIMMNGHYSFFSENLFFVIGFGGSYAKVLNSYPTELQNKVNFVINFGFDYNFDKIPVSIGFYNRFDTGYFSSNGISLKYIYK